MDILTLNLLDALLDAFSAAVCAALVWFMIKPYRFTGERRYVGLPLAFSFLTASYILGFVSYFESIPTVDVIRWLSLFSQSYAFAFLAVTYYFSNKQEEKIQLPLNIFYAAILSAIAISYIVIFVPPSFAWPDFKTGDDYMRAFNIICLSYVAVHTLRSHASKPDAKTIWIPLSYILFDFTQYSFLIWSLDSSFSAFVGAHFLRIAGLLIFLYVAYQTFYKSKEEYPKKVIE